MMAPTVLLLACWFGWGYPFIMRAPHKQKRPSVSRPWPTLLGGSLQCAAIFVAWAFRLTDDPGLGRVLLSAAFGPLAAWLAWVSVKHLGKQWRIQAGLYADHELVRTGPYRFVRHPVYASLLAILLSTLFLLTPWPWAALGVALFVAGTEIRIWAEEKFLASRFGEEFYYYRSRVPAYLPPIR